MALLALAGLVGVALREYPVRQAKADPPALGLAAWGTTDARIVDPGLLRRAMIRYALLCEPQSPGVTASFPLLDYANNGVLTGSVATIVSCALGAPTTATCSQLRECTGERLGEPAPPAPACSGVFAVSGIAIGSPGSGKPFRITESCVSQGARCHAGEGVAFCAGEACTPGETYACDGAKLTVCTQGVRVEAPCPVGTSCGASPGSGVLGCNGNGPACSDDGSRCVGSTLVACLRDGFGKGQEAARDCQSFGLQCVANGAGPSGTAECRVDAAPACDTKTTAWSCDAGLVKACVAGRFYTYACADLGMAGTCTQSPTGPACKP